MKYCKKKIVSIALENNWLKDNLKVLFYKLFVAYNYIED